MIDYKYLKNDATVYSFVFFIFYSYMLLILLLFPLYVEFYILPFLSYRPIYYSFFLILHLSFSVFISSQTIKKALNGTFDTHRVNGISCQVLT